MQISKNFIFKILLLLFYIDYLSANQEILDGTSVNNNFENVINLPVLPPGKCWNKQISNLQPPTDALLFKNEIYIQGCCNGYEVSSERPNECIANNILKSCYQECKNGICFSKNCTCTLNSVKSLSNDCVHICPVSCLNGQCLNNQCICNSGYELDEKTENFCKPICSKENIPKHSNCTEPNKFDCKKGFQWNTNHTVCERTKCTPFCGPGGRCISTNQCQCDLNKGFLLINGSCQNTCSNGCINGRCIKKDICRCDTGWKLNKIENVCEKINCSNSCINGNCSTTTGTCECRIGYRLNVKQNCVPICDGGCPFRSHCIKPGICKCRIGYFKRMGRCRRTRLLYDDLIYPELSKRRHHRLHSQSNRNHHGHISVPIPNNNQHSGLNYADHQIRHNSPHSGHPFAPNHIINNTHSANNSMSK